MIYHLRKIFIFVNIMTNIICCKPSYKLFFYAFQSSVIGRGKTGGRAGGKTGAGQEAGDRAVGSLLNEI